MSQEEWQLWRARAKDVGLVVLFLVAIAFFIVGGLLTSPANLGLIGSGMGLLAVVGISKA